MNHVKQGAIEVGTDLFEAASGFISDLFSSSESSASSSSPSYNYESDGLTVMMSGRQTIILDSDGNSLQKISDNLFRFNDDINLLITWVKFVFFLAIFRKCEIQEFLTLLFLTHSHDFRSVYHFRQDF